MSRIAHVARTARRATTSLALLACLGAIGCDRSRDATADTAGATGAADVPATTPPADTAGAPGPVGATTLNDAQIAHVAVTANSLDSAAGVLARGKGQSQAVKDFARTMVTDHTGVNEKAVALAQRLNVTPADNDVSRQLKSDAERSQSNLQGMSGANFDRAYIDHEVTYHQTVLDALDKTLIPGAQNADLKKLLQDVRPNIAAHLERARSIQSSLGPT